MQVERLDATVRELQDIHQDLKKKAATCNGSFSNRQPTPPSFDWVVTWMLEPWHRWKRRALERQRLRIWSNRRKKWWGSLHSFFACCSKSAINVSPKLAFSRVPTSMLLWLWSCRLHSWSLSDVEIAARAEQFLSYPTAAACCGQWNCYL